MYTKLVLNCICKPHQFATNIGTILSFIFMNMEGTETEVIADPMQIPRFAIFFIEKTSN